MGTANNRRWTQSHLRLVSDRKAKLTEWIALLEKSNMPSVKRRSIVREWQAEIMDAEKTIQQLQEILKIEAANKDE